MRVIARSASMRRGAAPNMGAQGGSAWANSKRLGDAVTGALLARAVEPSAGEVGADGHTHEAQLPQLRDAR